MSLIPSRLAGPLHIGGLLSADSLSLPSGTVRNAGVADDAAIEPTKLKHEHSVTVGQPNTTAADETRMIHIARGTGVVVAFAAGAIGPNVGAAIVEIDLLKNGSSILTAPIEINSGHAARELVAGALSGTPTLAAGDKLEWVVDGTAGGGTLGTGVFANLVTREAAA